MSIGIKQRKRRSKESTKLLFCLSIASLLLSLSCLAVENSLQESESGSSRVTRLIHQDQATKIKDYKYFLHSFVEPDTKKDPKKAGEALRAIEKISKDDTNLSRLVLEKNEAEKIEDFSLFLDSYPQHMKKELFRVNLMINGLTPNLAELIKEDKKSSNPIGYEGEALKILQENPCYALLSILDRSDVVDWISLQPFVDKAFIELIEKPKLGWNRGGNRQEIHTNPLAEGLLHHCSWTLGKDASEKKEFVHATFHWLEHSSPEQQANIIFQFKKLKDREWQANKTAYAFLVQFFNIGTQTEQNNLIQDLLFSGTEKNPEQIVRSYFQEVRQREKEEQTEKQK